MAQTWKKKLHKRHQKVFVDNCAKLINLLENLLKKACQEKYSQKCLSILESII